MSIDWTSPDTAYAIIYGLFSLFIIYVSIALHFSAKQESFKKQVRKNKMKRYINETLTEENLIKDLYDYLKSRESKQTSTA